LSFASAFALADGSLFTATAGEGGAGAAGATAIGGGAGGVTAVTAGALGGALGSAFGPSLATAVVFAHPVVWLAMLGGADTGREATAMPTAPSVVVGTGRGCGVAAASGSRFSLASQAAPLAAAIATSPSATSATRLDRVLLFFFRGTETVGEADDAGATETLLDGVALFVTLGGGTLGLAALFGGLLSGIRSASPGTDDGIV
jgi:hypothetical protein